MRWTNEDLERLKGKGLKIDDKKFPEPIKATAGKKKVKIAKISVEKNTIELFLNMFLQEGKIQGYEREYRFDSIRRFRFDWAIPSLMIAIEYNGLIYNTNENSSTGRSGHQTIGGIKADNEKSNLAVTQGWRILVYTAMNYTNLEADLNKILLDK